MWESWVGIIISLVHFMALLIGFMEWICTYAGYTSKQ